MKAGITMTLAACLGGCVAGSVLAAEPADSAFAEVNLAAPKLSGDGISFNTLGSNVVSGTGSDSSFSYGAGFQLPCNRNRYLQAGYNSPYDEDGVAIKGPAIGMGYRF